MTPRPGLLVIGNGPAGTSAAAAYVEAGGAGPVLVLSADVDEHYQRPPLSKTVLAGEEPPERQPAVEDESSLVDVEVRLGSPVVSLRPEQRTVGLEDGTEVRYERLVLATGSHPASLPGVEAGANVHTLRSLEDARALDGAVREARSALVVGSGFIGCEAAASLAHRGLDTVLVSPEPQPQAARLGDWVGQQITRWLTDAGVRVHSGHEVQAVTSTTQVQIAAGHSYDVDVVLVAVGVDQGQPWLEASGLRTEEGHVLTGPDLLTSDPRIWAAGDVARAEHAVAGRHLSVEHWGDALAMGRVAGRSAAGVDATWEDVPGFWSEIGEHTLKYSAWGDGYASSRVIEGPDGSFTVWYADEDGVLVGVLTHDRDEDYERGADLMARRATIDEATRP